MKARTSILHLTLLLVFCTTGDISAQNVPSDLEIIATAGGLGPDAEYATIRVTADGQASYRRFMPGDPGTPAIESFDFALSNAEMEALWQQVESSNFFSLDAEFTDDQFFDRTFAELIVTANSNSHTVLTQNIAVPAFDAIMALLNEQTPATADLVYFTEEPFTFTQLDVCEQPGKRGVDTLGKDHLRKGGIPDVSFLEKSSTSISSDLPHPGTVVACGTNLRSLVDAGAVELSGKGEYFGDAVSITIDNSSGIAGGQLSLTLYLEFWGADATNENGEEIEEAIESVWGGMQTALGANLNVDVKIRTAEDTEDAPGTSGYHQIQLLNRNIISNVAGRGSSFDVNEGVGSGTWQTGRGEALYAHEAGHLFGLPDRYIDYRMQSDGTWKRRNDGEIFTVAELAAEIDSAFPDTNEEDLTAWLNSGIRRVTHPEPGYEDDLMATLSGDVLQSDIDYLATHADCSLTEGSTAMNVSVAAGDVLLSKDRFDQNMIITRSQDIFVSAGEQRTLGGLYAACIDHFKGIPGDGVGFDVAPSISAWTNVQGASTLQPLLNYMNTEDRFCGSDIEFQLAIWRITDDSDIGNPIVESALQEAGLDLGDQVFDFPHLTNLVASNPETSSFVSPELFVASVETSSDGLLDTGESVTLAASVEAPSIEDVSIGFSWMLMPPPGSAAELSDTEGENTSFTSDERGSYSVQLNTEVSDPVVGMYAIPHRVHFTLPDALTETFEGGVLEMEEPFYWEPIGSNPWVVSDETSNTGAYSAASAEIDDNQESRLRVRYSQASDGLLSFSYRASSEPVFDILTFTLDDQELGKWSGNEDWSRISFSSGAGDHEAVWVYSKDESESVGSDRAWIDDVFFPESAIFTAIEQSVDDVLPNAYGLLQNYPNPFSSVTTLGYAVPESRHVRITVYDAAGREVAVLVDGVRSPGRYDIRFEARTLSSGIYYVELAAGDFRERNSMILVD